MRKLANKPAGKGRTVTKDSQKVSLNKPTSEIDLPDKTDIDKYSQLQMSI